MYFPATRVLTILELLQSHYRLSGPELAARLEVDTRTVRRYITMLQDLGIPVEAERGRYGSYKLRPGFKLPPLMFTDDEALALTLGLLMARRIGLATEAPAVEGALAKVERVLPLALRERVQALQETLILDVPFEKSSPDSDVLNTLSLAAQQQRRVWLRYQSYKSEITEREFDPYGLVFRSGCWYTAGYCHLRNELRTFRLERILRAELRSSTFKSPADFDSVAHVQRAISNTPGKWLVEVLLEAPLAEIQRRISPAFALLEEVADGVYLRAYVDDLDWMAHMLAQLRCPMVIQRPPELRDALCSYAQYILEQAERGKCSEV